MDILALGRALENSQLEDDLCQVIDDKAGIVALIDTLIGLPTNHPSLFVDLEGVNLSLQGSVSIFQLFVRPQGRTYLLDVHVLKHDTFTTAGSNGETLQSILEAKAIPKVFFDIRNDYDALFGNFGIRVAGIQDLQLMELATRTRSKRCVN